MNKLNALSAACLALCLGGCVTTQATSTGTQTSGGTGQSSGNNSGKPAAGNAVAGAPAGEVVVPQPEINTKAKLAFEDANKSYAEAAKKGGKLDFATLE